MPSSSASPGASVAASSARNWARRSGREVADRAAEERDERVPPPGQLAEVVLEVADDRVHAHARVLGRDRRGRVAQRRLAHVERHEASSVPASRRASSSRRVFSEVPEPSSTSVSAC